MKTIAPNLLTNKAGGRKAPSKSSRRHFHESSQVGDHVVKTYLGRSDRAAAVVAQVAAPREARIAERDAVAAKPPRRRTLAEAAADLDRRADDATKAVMLQAAAILRVNEGAGVRNTAMTPLQATLQSARLGDTAILPQLRAALDADPALWKSDGDFAKMSQELWITLIAPVNLLHRECMRRHLEALTVEIGGDAPSPTERLLVERAISAYAQAHEADWTARTAGDGGDIKRARFLMSRQEVAHRRFLSTIKVLAEVQLANNNHKHPTAREGQPTVARSPLETAIKSESTASASSACSRGGRVDGYLATGLAADDQVSAFVK